MRCNYKALSLVLLTSMALGAYAHSSRSTCDCDKKERILCKETCCDVGIDKKKCKAKPASLAYDCCLSFEQTVVSKDLGLEGVVPAPRDVGDKPHGVCGRFKICFAPDCSKAEYELSITGLNIQEFPNQRPLGAFLYFSTAANILGAIIPLDNSQIVTLCGLDNIGNTADCTTPKANCSTMKNGTFCCKAKLTSEQLNKSVLRFKTGVGEESATIPTCTALLEAIRAGKVSLLVNGGSMCDKDDKAPEYGLLDGGMLRCQLSGEEVAGVTANADISD